MQFTRGDRVEYVGDLIHRLKGQYGTFEQLSPVMGWAVVAFDKLYNMGPLYVAPANLRKVDDDD